MKIGVKAKRRKYFCINFVETTFCSVQVNVYALVLLIKSELSSRRVDDLNYFTEISVVTKKTRWSNSGNGPLL